MPFNGKATDSTGDFLNTPEDVSSLITLISPKETPYLDRIGDAAFQGLRTLHEFLEEYLAPNALSITSGLSSPAPGTQQDWQVGGGLAAFIMEGTILETQAGEQMRVVTGFQGPLSPNTITVTRGFAGTACVATSPGDLVDVIGTAHLEGRDANADVSRPRPRKLTTFQLFSKDVKMTGT